MPIYQLRDSEQQLRVFRSLPFSDHFVERDLESWLEKNPGVLVEDEPLMVIGRQVQTSVGVIDLLAVDTDGAVVVAELKRAPSQREAVSQSLEYAAWVAEQDPASLRSEAVRYLRKQRADDSFEAAWKRTFGSPQPNALLNVEPRVFVVIEGDDARMFSMANFLRRCGVEITLLTYGFYRTDGGEQFIQSLPAIAIRHDERRAIALRKSPTAAGRARSLGAQELGKSQQRTPDNDRVNPVTLQRRKKAG